MDLGYFWTVQNGRNAVFMLCWSREFPKYFQVIFWFFEVGDENFGMEIGGRNFGSEVWIEPIPAIFDA